jgi:HlyD family secretion protein
MDRAIERPKWKSRRVIFGAAVAGMIVLLIGAATLANGSARSLRVPLSNVTIATVERGLFHDLTPLRGKVAPKDVIYLDALEGGQVEKIMAKAGDMVVAGQPLIQFRNTQLELDVRDREGRLVESITQLQAYEKQLEETRLANEKAVAQIDYDVIRLQREAARADPLVVKGYLPLTRRDQIHDELAHNLRIRPLQTISNERQEALRLQQIPQIRAELNGLKESLRITRAKLEDLIVQAPMSGRLTDVVQNIGENRNRGDRLGEIVPDTGFKVAATIDEFYLGRVRVGQVADVDLDGQWHKLRVDRVYPQVKDGVFAVDLAFTGPMPPGLLPGQSIDGKLTLGGDQPALVLPSGAFLERSGGDWMMVVDAAGRRAERRRVNIGRRNANQVEVLNGLKPGERVIISDYAAFEKIDRINLEK